MGNDGMMLPLGILLLGVSAIAGFMAFRPWPMPGGNPIKPGAYAVEILQGHPPAASLPPDRQREITVIEGGLVTLLGIWSISKLANGVSGLLGGAGGAAEKASPADELTKIEGDLANAGEDVLKVGAEGG